MIRFVIRKSMINLTQGDPDLDLNTHHQDDRIGLEGG